jgi:propionate catabolism operon transcriptional regulator
LDVRFITATTKDLQNEIKLGRFRQDLYYRMNVVPIKVPSLAERKEDIPLLVKYFVKQLAKSGLKEREFSDEAMAALQAYDWPGNVRELRNLMQRLALFLAAEPLQALTPAFVQNLAPELAGTDQTVRSARLELPALSSAEPDLQQIMARFDGNRAAAAAYLGMSRTTLWRRLKASST